MSKKVLYTESNLWRRSILHKGNWIQTLELLNLGYTKFSSMFRYHLAAAVPVTGPLRVFSLKKKGPIINVVVNPHQILTFGEWSGISWKVQGFFVSQMRQIWVLTVPLKWKCASSLHRICHVHDASTSTIAINVNAKANSFSLSIVNNCWL